MNKLFILILITSAFVACSENDDASNPSELQSIVLNGPDIESDRAVLDSLLAEIESQTNSVPCEDASEWEATPIGSKACGGPHFYLAYPTTLDVDSFLEQVEVYRLTEESFNAKWDVVSTCELPSEPTDVVCEDGSPVFVYE